MLRKFFLRGGKIMRKLRSGHTFWKDAGVVLIATLMFLTSVVVATASAANKDMKTEPKTHPLPLSPIICFQEDFESCTPPAVQFPPIDWAIYDENGNSKTWQYATINYDGCALCMGGFPDDWLVTKKVTPAPGKDFIFSLRGGYDNSISWFRDYVEVYSSSGNTPADFTDPINGHLLKTIEADNTGPDGFTVYSVSPYGTGDQYFAIRYVHKPSTITISLLLYIDDITLPDETTENFDSSPGDLGNWESTATLEPLGHNVNNRWEASSNGLNPPAPPQGGSSMMVQFNSHTIGFGTTVRLSTVGSPIRLSLRLRLHREISFWMYHDTALGLDCIAVCVKIINPLLPNAQWRTILIPGSNPPLPFTFFRNDGSGDTGWKLHTVTLPIYYNLFSVQIGFTGTSCMCGNVYLDDVTVTAY